MKKLFASLLAVLLLFSAPLSMTAETALSFFDTVFTSKAEAYVASTSIDNANVKLECDWKINSENAIEVYLYFTDAVDLCSWDFLITYDSELFSYIRTENGRDAKAVNLTLNNSFTDETSSSHGETFSYAGYFKESLWTSEEFLADSGFKGDAIVDSENFEAAVFYLEVLDTDAFLSESTEINIDGVMKFHKGDYYSAEKSVSDAIISNNCTHLQSETIAFEAATCTAQGIKTLECTKCGKIITDILPVDPTNHVGKTEFRNITVLPTVKMPGEGELWCLSCNKRIKEEIEVPPVDSLGYGMCGENVRWTLNKDGTLYIFGTGSMSDYAHSNTPWSEKGLSSSIKKIIIENGVTHIGNSAFSNCHSVSSVSLANSIISIDELAFSACSALIDIDLPDSLHTIADNAFFACSGMTEIAIPDCVTQLTYGAFRGCIRLEKVSLPNNLKTIEASAFAGCTSLSEITIPDSVNEIYCNAFDGCSALTSITIPHTMEFIGNNVFVRCSSLASVLFLGTDCEIYDSPYTIPEDTSIISHAGSTAQSYALKYNRTFEEINCSHPFTEPIPDKPASCAQAGHTGGIRCSVCKKTIKKPTVIVSDEHIYESFVTKEPTHLKTGETLYTCTVCGYQKTETLAKLPEHSYNATIVAPDCDSTGYTIYICQCGHNYIEDYVLALGHIDTDGDEICDRCRNPYGENILLGDVDGNGNIQAADARLVLRASVGLEIFDEQQRKAADADRNGVLQAADARLILRASVGIEALN